MAVRSGLYTDVMVKKVGYTITGGINHGCITALEDEDQVVEEQDGEKEIDVEARRAQNRFRWAESEEKKMEGDETLDTAAGSTSPEGAAPTPRMPPVPRAPLPEQIASHELTHTPYANWCPTCVAAMGKDLPHRRVPEDPAAVPVVELDHGFLTTAAKDDELISILVGAQRHSGYGFAAATPAKGRSDVPAIVGFVRFLMEASLTANLRMRSDSEPAAQAVAQAVASRRAPAVTTIETNLPPLINDLRWGVRL